GLPRAWFPAIRGTSCTVEATFCAWSETVEATPWAVSCAKEPRSWTLDPAEPVMSSAVGLAVLIGDVRAGAAFATAPLLRGLAGAGAGRPGVGGLDVPALADFLATVLGQSVVARLTAVLFARSRVLGT